MCLAKWIGPFVSNLWMRLYVFGQVDRAFCEQSLDEAICVWPSG